MIHTTDLQLKSHTEYIMSIYKSSRKVNIFHTRAESFIRHSSLSFYHQRKHFCFLKLNIMSIYFNHKKIAFLFQNLIISSDPNDREKSFNTRASLSFHTIFSRDCTQKKIVVPRHKAPPCWRIRVPLKKNRCCNTVVTCCNSQCCNML